MQARKEYIIQFVGLSVGEHLYEFNISDSFFEDLEYSEIKQGNISEVDRKSMLNIVNGNLTYDKYAFHSFDIATLYAIRKADKEVILGITTSSYAPTQIKDLSNLYPCFYNLGSSGFAINQSFNAQSNQNIYSMYLGGIFVCIWTVDDPKYFDFLTSNSLYILTNTLPPVFK